MSSRFDYIPFDEYMKSAQNNFKEIFKTLENEIDLLTPGRSQSLAMTHLETAYMWVGKALKEEQERRNIMNSNQTEFKDI